MEDKNILYVTLLAIVAIVALVALSGSSQKQIMVEEPMLDDEGNVVGYAMRGYGRSTSRVTTSRVQRPSGEAVPTGAIAVPQFPSMQYRAKKDTGTPPPPPPPPKEDD